MIYQTIFGQSHNFFCDYFGFDGKKRAGKTLTALIQDLTVSVQFFTNKAKNLNFRDKNLNISIKNLTNEVKRLNFVVLKLNIRVKDLKDGILNLNIGVQTPCLGSNSVGKRFIERSLGEL